MRPGSRCALLAVVVTWCCAVPANAIVLSEDPLSGDSLDLGATMSITTNVAVVSSARSLF